MSKNFTKKGGENSSKSFFIYGTCNISDVLFGEEHGEKNGTLPAARGTEGDAEALLLPHVLLTIGTFGHSTPHQPEEPTPLDHQEDQEPKQTPHNSTLSNPTAAVVTPHHSTEIEIFKPETLTALGTVNVEEEEITSRVPLLKEDKEKMEKRTTLADLLAAESASAAAPGSDAPPVNGVNSADKHLTAPPTNNAKKTKKGEESPHSAKKIRRVRCTFQVRSRISL